MSLKKVFKDDGIISIVVYMEQLPLPKDIILIIKKFAIQHPLAKIMKGTKKPLKEIKRHKKFPFWWPDVNYINEDERWYYYDMYYLQTPIFYLFDEDPNFSERYIRKWYPKYED